MELNVVSPIGTALRVLVVVRGERTVGLIVFLSSALGRVAGCVAMGRQVVGKVALPVRGIEHLVGVVHGADGLPLLLEVLALANVREVLVQVIAHHQTGCLNQIALVLRIAVLRRQHRWHHAIF